MNKYLLARIKQDTPKMNPSLANGLATEYVPKAIDYIDRVWRDASKGFPPELRYVGCRVCTPLEEFYTDGVKSKKKYVELARSDIFLVRYDFTYNGVPLEPRYIYLPFANEAGSIRLGGSTYFISPILSDTVLSGEQWVLLHIEVQGRGGEDLSRRMMRYYCLLFAHYDKNPVALAILTASRPKSETPGV